MYTSINDVPESFEEFVVRMNWLARTSFVKAFRSGLSQFENSRVLALKRFDSVDAILVSLIISWAIQHLCRQNIS